MNSEQICTSMCLQDAVTICGLTDCGYLLACGSGGQLYELHPDGISLDLMSGMIKRKLAP